MRCYLFYYPLMCDKEMLAYLPRPPSTCPFPPHLFIAVYPAPRTVLSTCSCYLIDLLNQINDECWELILTLLAGGEHWLLRLTAFPLPLLPLPSSPFKPRLPWLSVVSAFPDLPPGEAARSGGEKPQSLESNRPNSQVRRWLCNEARVNLWAQRYYL